MPFIFKSSFDKANRTSLTSFRGPGLEAGLRILAEVRRECGVPVLTDVHESGQVAAVAAVVDVLQTPAFLCRQTDFLLDVARAGKPVNVKKGQFLAPWDMRPVLEKLASTGNEQLLVTERGVSLRLQQPRRRHALAGDHGGVRLPGGVRRRPQRAAAGRQGAASGGQRQFIRALARAAVAVGVDALFLEVHEDPDRAMSDGPNSYRLADLEALLRELKRIDAIAKEG